LVVALGVSGCTRDPRPIAADSSPTVASSSDLELTTPAEVWAFAGEPVAVPLSQNLLRPGQTEVVVQTGTRGSRALPIWRITRPSSSLSPLQVSAWFGPTRPFVEQRAIAREQESKNEAGVAWVVLAHDDSDVLSIDGRRTRIRTLNLSTSGLPALPASSPPTLSSPDESLKRALLPVLASPFAAWRARLALGVSLVPDDLRTGGVDAGPIAAIDRTESLLWHEAISRLQMADPAISARVVQRLAGIVEFEGYARTALWPQDASSLAQLRADLLASDLGAEERVLRARTWLQAQPIAAAWVVDDAGLRDATTGALICSVMVANLSDSPASVSAVVEGAGITAAGPDLFALQPRSAAILRAAGLSGDSGRERTVVVRVGGGAAGSRGVEWTKRLKVVCSSMPAQPPGFSVGPLVMDANSTQLLAATEQSARGVPGSPDGVELPPASRATIGMLLAEPSDVDGAGGGQKTAARWTLFVECMISGVEAMAVDTDRLRIFLGASGDGRGGSTGNRSGAGVREIIVAAPRVADDGTSNETSTPSGVRAVRKSDRWVCWIPIPTEAIERDGRLRIGLHRELTAGLVIERAAWPRPMFPWQQEPGRLCVELNAWNARPAEAGKSGR